MAAVKVYVWCLCGMSCWEQNINAFTDMPTTMPQQCHLYLPTPHFQTHATSTEERMFPPTLCIHLPTPKPDLHSAAVVTTHPSFCLPVSLPTYTLRLAGLHLILLSLHSLCLSHLPPVPRSLLLGLLLLSCSHYLLLLSHSYSFSYSISNSYSHSYSYSYYYNHYYY